MSGSNDRSREETGDGLEIVRKFDAPRGLLYPAWIDPERMAQWSAPQGYTFVP